MSGRATEWAFQQATDLAPTLRFVLVAMGDDATRSGHCVAGPAEIATKTGYNRQTVSKAIRELRDLGLITGAADNRGRGDFLLALDVVESDSQPSSSPTPPSPTTTAKTRSSSLGVRGSPKSDVPPDETREEGDLKLTPEAQAVLDNRAKVDRRRVTAFEVEKAAAALDEFNKQSERELVLTTAEWLRMIVMRVRSRPTLTAEQHRHLVQSAFRFKWWERQGRSRGPRVSPSVIYGSDRCFENVLQDAIDEAKGKPVDADRAGKYAVIENRDV